MKFVRFMRRSVVHTFLCAFVLMELLMSSTAILQLLPELMPGFFSPAVITGFFYAAFLGVWGILPYLLIFPWTRPILKGMWSKPAKKNGIGFAIGIVLGFGMNLVCFMAAWLHGDLELNFALFQPVTLILLFVCVFIQSGAEELVTRLYIYQKLRLRFHSRWPAILLNAALFGALHLLNNGISVLAIVDIILFGVLESLVMIVTDSIWAAIGLHTAWNFCQSILLGLPNSGNLVPYSMYRLNEMTARNSFAYDVSFGLEGTVFTVCLTACVCVVLTFIMYRYNRTDTDLFVEYRAREQARLVSLEHAKKEEENK